MSSDLHPLTLPETSEPQKTDVQPVESSHKDNPWLTILRWFDSWAGIEK